LLSLYTSMFHWGAIVVAPGYTDQSAFGAGGNPYGTSVTAGENGMVEDVEDAVKHQAKRTVEVATVVKNGSKQYIIKVENQSDLFSVGSFFSRHSRIIHSYPGIVVSCSVKLWIYSGLMLFYSVKIHFCSGLIIFTILQIDLQRERTMVTSHYFYISLRISH